MKAWITIYNGGERYFLTKELAQDYLMTRSKAEGKSAFFYSCSFP